jgi:hypothetical protein
MDFLATVVFFAIASVAVFAQQPKPPVRVYVWTAKVGIEEGVADLTEKLDPKWLVASSKDTSELQVEITQKEVPGLLSPGSLRAGTRPIPILTLHATLRFNDSSTDLVCTPTWFGTATAPTWKDAAGICAKKTKAWVKANLKQLRREHRKSNCATSDSWQDRRPAHLLRSLNSGGGGHRVSQGRSSLALCLARRSDS